MSNSYYTHCYHDILYSYDSGGHLMDTTKQIKAQYLMLGLLCFSHMES